MGGTIPTLVYKMLYTFIFGGINDYNTLNKCKQ